VLEGGEGKAVTGKDGRAFMTGLGDSVSGRVRTNIDGIDAFFVSSPPSNIDFSPRPGKVVQIAYPLTPVAEVLAKIELQRENGQRIGLSAVRMRLVRDGMPPHEATTEFDGTTIFSNVPPGEYRLEIDPEQAARLKMRLKEPVTVSVNEDGSAGDAAAEVVFSTAG